MLALTRRLGETIKLTVPPSDKATTVEVTFVRLRGKMLVLGFEAPREVDIARKEIDDGRQESGWGGDGQPTAEQRKIQEGNLRRAKYPPGTKT